MKHSSTRTVLAAAAVLALGLGAAACGSDDDSSSATTAAAAAPTVASVTTDAPATTAAPTTEVATTDAATEPTDADDDDAGYGSPDTTAATTAGATADAVVTTAETDLGTILVDAEGRTLYMFAPDKQGPSTCLDKCLAAWPALTGPATAGEGVDETLLATAERSDDGSAQVTYGGWPLYYFANDPAPGDINGQGVGDVWYVVDPSGAPVGMPGSGG